MVAVEWLNTPALKSKSNLIYIPWNNAQYYRYKFFCLGPWFFTVTYFELVDTRTRVSINNKFINAKSSPSNLGTYSSVILSQTIFAMQINSQSSISTKLFQICSKAVARFFYLFWWNKNIHRKPYVFFWTKQRKLREIYTKF